MPKCHFINSLCLKNSVSELRTRSECHCHCEDARLWIVQSSFVVTLKKYVGVGFAVVAVMQCPSVRTQPRFSDSTLVLLFYWLAFQDSSSLLTHLGTRSWCRRCRTTLLAKCKERDTQLLYPMYTCERCYGPTTVWRNMAGSKDRTHIQKKEKGCRHGRLLVSMKCIY